MAAAKDSPGSPVSPTERPPRPRAARVERDHDENAIVDRRRGCGRGVGGPGDDPCGAVRGCHRRGSGGVRHRRPVVLRGAEPDPGRRAWRSRSLAADRDLLRPELPDHVPLPDRRRRPDGGHRAGRRVGRPAPVRRLPAAALRPRHDRDGRCVRTVRRHRRPRRALLHTAPSSSRSATRTDDGWVVVATDYEGLGGPGSHPMLSASARGGACSTPGVRRVRSLVSTSPHRRRLPDSPKVAMPPCGQLSWRRSGHLSSRSSARSSALRRVNPRLWRRGRRRNPNAAR